MKPGLFFTVLLLLLTFHVSSQQFNFRSYSVGEGLAQSQVFTMVDDKQGYLWFGTRGGGLSRFDGIHFENFTVRDGLPSNYIRSLCQDGDTLWIGTDEGLSGFDGKIFFNYGESKGLYNTTVNAVIRDRNKVLWLATETGIFHLEKDTIYRFGRKLGVPMERFNCLYEDVQGNIWAGSEKGLYTFSLSQGSWSSRLITSREGLPGNIVTSVFQTEDGSFWVTTYGTGIGRFSGNRWQVFGMKDGLGSNTVFYGCRGKGNSLWFGTANGVTRCDTSGTGFRFRNFTETEGLANNVVMCAMKDAFGNTWFGTSGGGISKLGNERFTHYTALKGIFGNWVYAILQDRQGNYWFGTSEGGVTRYDGKYYKRFSEKDGFTASKVKTIHQDREGNLWFGTIADGAFRYDGKRFRHFYCGNGLGSNFINCIVSDSLGRLYMATAGGGISCLYPYGRTYRFFFIKQREGLPGDRVNVLLPDSNFIWAGMAGKGICKIIPPSDTVPAKVTRYDRAGDVTFSHIRSVVRRDDGMIFFGTADAGILAYDGKVFYPAGTDHGLTSDNIYSLLLDEENNLWAGTEKGLDKIYFTEELKVGNVKHYGRPEGFIGIETIQNSVCKDREGHLWFGSVKCATMYDASMDKEQRAPRIKLTNINLFFDPLDQTPYGRDLDLRHPVSKPLVMPYDQNHLSFEFIGIEHANPEAVKYQWMLEGFDTGWTPVSRRTDATYSNLSPGSYIFKVRAASESNMWSGVATFPFVITPPFWKTWWFYLSCFLVSFALIWYTGSSRYKKLRRKNEQERARLEMERNLLELEQKALRLQMNPHFLFNCLNSIKGLIAEGKDDEAKLYLTRFSKLMRSILENSGGTFISLENEIAGLKNYADLEKLNLGDKLDVIVEVDQEIDPEMVGIPSMLIQPFVENSIVHGIAPKQGKGWVKIFFRKEDHHIRCLIEDNGIGREKAGKLKSASLDTHRSAALAITQERLNIINKKLNFDQLRIDIRDKETDGRSEGTIVELILPYQYL